MPRTRISHEETQRIIYFANEVIGCAEEYLALPTTSLQDRMTGAIEALSNAIPKENKWAK